MGRFAGFRYRQVMQRLTALGFVFSRHAAGSHEIWLNTSTGRYTTIPNRPGDIPEGELCAFPRQAGVSQEAFLEGRAR